MSFKGSIEEKCTKLYQFTKKNKGANVIQSYLIKFINHQKQRIEKEISEGTLVNYIKAIKLFYSMNDIIINWKKKTAIPYYPSNQNMCKRNQA